MNEHTLAAEATPEKEARSWAMACHLSALCGFAIPLGNVIGPLIVWAMKKDEYAFVDDQGKEMLNFQLTLLLAYVLSAALMFVLVGFVLLAMLVIYSLIMTVVAAMQANDGVRYRFPCTIRFFK